MKNNNFSPPKFEERIDFKQLNRQLQPYILQLLRRLLPDGKVRGREYVAINPTRYDKQLGSFKINKLTGKWSDFATSDKGGDFISLWAYVRNLKQIEAAKEIISIIGRGA